MKHSKDKFQFFALVSSQEDEVERDQKQMIKEAFAGDDVIKEFLKEKREAIQANKPKDLDLTLPGWGEWGGMDLKPSAKKRHRWEEGNPVRRAQFPQPTLKCVSCIFD